MPAELCEQYRFTAGQHVVIRGRRDGEPLRRSYSLCGPTELVRDSVRTLTGRGVDRERISFELFDTESAEPIAAQADTTAATVTLTGYGDDLVCIVPRDTPILAAAVRIREDLPYSCLGGSCGTCLATVESGAVEQDSDPLLAISADGIAAGKILACRTRPTSDAVTLRFES